jgi:uncharacterized C2H2 Zn-finger protein
VKPIIENQNGMGEDLSKYFKCRSCGNQFDNLGDMQRHIMSEHMQKGDIPDNRIGKVRME